MTNRVEPFQALFSRYINSKIDERNWSRFSAVCDLPGIVKEERQAFASYMLDSIDNDESLYLPRACEAEALFDAIRPGNTSNIAVGF